MNTRVLQSSVSGLGGKRCFGSGVVSTGSHIACYSGYTMEVGIRDLKNGLSRYLKRVQRGETIVVTDHGHAVARIVPAGVPEDLENLLREGRLHWSGRRFEAPAKVPTLTKGRPLSDYISEDRR